MKKLIILTVGATVRVVTVFGQCSSVFSFSVSFETVTFANLSGVSNAHYFWNFGDGSGSDLQNPIHTFPEAGNYFVTLFAKDTISNCTTYYENWVSVSKYSGNICKPAIIDSVWTSANGADSLQVLDNSVNCNAYFFRYSAGPAQNSSPSWIVHLAANGYNTVPYRMVCIGKYYDFSWTLKREAFKSSLLNYTSAKNYGDCSANFEFKVVSQDSNGQTILFSAMNKTATYYKWIISGFGLPIYSNYDTISKYYPYAVNDLWSVCLIIHGSSGCIDSLYQNIIPRESISTTTSIKEIKNDVQYSLYPNPFRDKAVLNFSSVNDKLTFDLFNINGQLVQTRNSISNSQVVVERENLPGGIYYFMVRRKDKIIAKGKLIAE